MKKRIASNVAKIPNNLRTLIYFSSLQVNFRSLKIKVARTGKARVRLRV